MYTMNEHGEQCVNGTPVSVLYDWFIADDEARQLAHNACESLIDLSQKYRRDMQSDDGFEEADLACARIMGAFGVTTLEGF